MELLYGRAGRLNTKTTGFRPGQLLGQLKTVDWSTSLADNPDDEPVTDETSDGLNGVRFHRLITLQNGHVVTIPYRKLNTFRRLFGPPFTITKSYWSPFSHTKDAARAGFGGCAVGTRGVSTS